jgi:hypothetical protein
LRRTSISDDVDMDGVLLELSGIESDLPSVQG